MAKIVQQNAKNAGIIQNKFGFEMHKRVTKMPKGKQNAQVGNKFVGKSDGLNTKTVLSIYKQIPNFWDQVLNLC